MERNSINLIIMPEFRIQKTLVSQQINLYLLLIIIGFGCQSKETPTNSTIQVAKTFTDTLGKDSITKMITKVLEKFGSDTIFTDSSKIIIGEYPGGREVKEYFNKKNLVRWTFYYTGTDKVMSQCNYDTLGNRIGTLKEYDYNGNLKFTHNYDLGKLNIVNTNLYPNLPILERIKNKADSIVIATYGEAFFKKNVIWNLDYSCYYTDFFHGNDWTEETKVVPNRFLIRYDLKLSNFERYYQQIELRLDSLGTLMLPHDGVDKIIGLEKNRNIGQFKLNKEIALNKAKKLGLKESKKIKAACYLEWQVITPNNNSAYDGEFVYCVSIQVYPKHTLEPDANMKKKFDIYRFNPWTGEFKSKITEEQNLGIVY